ncbi:Aste57867_11554 [Aphanomyces stellatus]|uniref:Aste57867_11554 protein n=1 Tax=Aphanomyces stellatus TaxID=120398 RepID=A0A485KUG3_9STRA|nr:hypothetical protein As57867_011511 [Aphanomyces stellatus]VFT88413.1 Aste57867_11554 [Aphanomyces stellatus]
MKSTAKQAEISRLIEECTTALEKDPTCLRTRAIRGHACMKAKRWSLAAGDFSAILEVRHDDIYGRFSRGMALFKGGHIERAHEDFSAVLKMNPNHVMARYARAGCYNTEGEFGRAIQDYTIALQCDENGHDKGLRGESRLYLHETAEKVINDKLSLSYRTRDAKASPARPLRGDAPIVDNTTTALVMKMDGHALPAVPRVARVTIDLTKHMPQSNPQSNNAVDMELPSTSSIKRSVKRVTVTL